MTTLSIEIRGLEEALAAFEGAENTDFSAALDRAGLRFRAMIDENLDNQVDPFGVPFPPPSPNTARFRSDPNALLLLDTGSLAGSISHEARARALDISANIDYASYHNDGNPDTNLPQRQFIPGEELPDEWVQILDFELNAVLQDLFNA